MTISNPQIGYAAVNGLKLYYERHGSGGHPLVLLPGTSHTGMVDRAAMLVPMIVPFLDAPLPDAN